MMTMRFTHGNRSLEASVVSDALLLKIYAKKKYELLGHVYILREDAKELANYISKSFPGQDEDKNDNQISG